MKKTTKGALAALAGGTLVFGGAGSLAYWNGAETVTGSAIDSGTFTLSAPDCSSAGGTHDWQFDGGATFTPGTDTVVPGDVLTKVCVFELELVGNHISATLGADSAAFTNTNGLTAELVPSAVFTIAGDPMPATISDEGTFTIQADISVTFDGAAATNTSQTLQAALDDITVTATQTHTPPDPDGGCCT
jgi:alternate signal-mediated exported protein